jgi:hypothetical protein
VGGDEGGAALSMVVGIRVSRDCVSTRVQAGCLGFHKQQAVIHIVKNENAALQQFFSMREILFRMEKIIFKSMIFNEIYICLI